MSHGLFLSCVLMVGCRVMLLVPGGLPQAAGFTTSFPRGAYPVVSPFKTISISICLWDSSLHPSPCHFCMLYARSGNWALQNKALRKRKQILCSLFLNHSLICLSLAMWCCLPLSLGTILLKEGPTFPYHCIPNPFRWICAALYRAVLPLDCSYHVAA